MNKKCIVLDLDNTLWGGTVGEDGFDGIKLSISGPGAPFIAFQQALLDLYDRGVILAINSRNNFEEAIRVIRSHPNMILKDNHLFVHQPFELSAAFLLQVQPKLPHPHPTAKSIHP